METSYYKKGKSIIRIRDGKETTLNEIGSANRAKHLGGWDKVADYSTYKPSGQPAGKPLVNKVTPTPTPTPPPTAPAGQPQTTNYAGLTNKDGTIYSGDTPFSSEADLATHLGIQPHEINWGNIPQAPTTPTEISTDVLDTPITTEDIQAQVTSPIESIQSVFGADWTPAPIFDQLGLTEQGIHGAVRIKGMNDVYTIGAGGRKETAESYLERFGTAEQEGIVGEISMEEAKALGITIGADSIIEPIIPKDPFEVWEHFRDEDKAEIDEMRTKLFEATNSLIDAMKGYGEDKAEAKDTEKEKLGIDAKDKAITDAEKTYADAMQVYSEVLLKNRSTSGAMSRILGTESRITAQRAIEMAPLSANILIAQNSYDRAKDLLDDWSDDYAESMKWQMSAAELNINMLTGELNREQAENLEEAKIKFDIWQNEENRRLDTAEETKKLMLMYPSAGVLISDSWEDAYKKISPYVQSEADFEQKMRDLDLAIAQKAFAKPYWKATGGTTEPEEIVKWSQKVEDAGLAGMPQWKVDDILNNPTPTSWFNEAMSEEHQMSKDWQSEWTKERNKVIAVYGEGEKDKSSDDAWMDSLVEEAIKKITP